MGEPKPYGLNRLRDTMVVCEATTRSMKANSGSDTGPEVRLRRALWAAGLRGYRKNDRRVFGKPDISFPRAKVCVFVHGCFWHGCESCSKNLKPKQNKAFWEAKIARNRARDAEVLETLKAQGYKTLVFWECELRSNTVGAVSQIIADTASA